MLSLTEKTYQFKWDKDSGRKAKIVFKADEEGFIFASCNYSGVSNSAYDLDDWEFLRDLAGEILRLAEKEEKNNDSRKSIGV